MRIFLLVIQNNILYEHYSSTWLKMFKGIALVNKGLIGNINLPKENSTFYFVKNEFVIWNLFS